MLDKIIKFALSGASAAGINLGLFFVLEHIWNVNYALAVIISTTCSATYHFALQKLWVFKSHIKEAVKTESYLFVIASIINLLLNEVLLWVFVESFHIHPFFSQIVALGLLACMNFFLYEFFIFRKSHRGAGKLHAMLDRVKFKHVLLIVGCLMWAGAHFYGVVYGTRDIPLHQSYVGDEQAPVNGALHMLNDKSLLAVHNLKTLYYGPVFAVIALPAVAGDFAWKYVTGQIRSAEAYKNSILWDWGGIIRNARAISVFASLIGLVAVFYLARTTFFNPSRNHFLPYLATSLVALNFYYFEYSHFFKHWIYITVLFLVQLFVIAKICDESEKSKRNKWWIANALLIALSFGISYTSLFFQLIWIGFLLKWLREKNTLLREWLVSMSISFVAMLLIFWWHPYALLRIFQGGATKPFGEEMLGFGYFGKLIVLNHAGLLLALIASALYFIKTRTASVFKYAYSASIIWGLTTVGVLQYVLFSAQPGLNREGRYMLPTIICLLLICVYVLGIYFASGERKRILNAVIITGLAFTIVFHVTHIVRWIYIFDKGPAEERMLSGIEDIPESEKLLLVQYYIAGAPHTIEAYKDYMDRFGRSEVNLFKQLLTAPTGQGVRRLNAYYIRPDRFVASDVKDFDRVIYLSEPRHEINQFDYFDEDVTRLWWYDELSPSYHVIK